MNRSKATGRRGRPRAINASLARTPPRVAMLVETSTSFGRQLIEGVAQFVRENGPWSIYVEQRSIYDPPPTWLARWDGDGLIAKAAYEEVANTIRSLPMPIVDLNEQVLGLGRPLVFNDNRAIGAMAADALLQRGYRQFGFAGYADIYWSDQRLLGFAAAVEQDGGVVHRFHSRSRPQMRYQHESWDEEIATVGQWLAQLPKPVGVLAANDFRAVEVLDACRRQNIAVPEQVAVIGVDDESVAQAMAYPPLSTVVPNATRMGYLAAGMLDQMMAGRPLDEQAVYVPPLQVINRQSTDLIAIDDPFVAKALRFIRESACLGITTEDVLAHTDVSRSTLQRRFRDVLHRTIHDEIIRIRMQRVTELLSSSELSLAGIAERSGLKHPEYLSAVFKRQTGMTITAFRQSLGMR
ncbi:XylR family transcriptional regulator [Phycisphaerales bacterium AB-hyl4]|uniref:XylR family transcriptional regulator n=1 Tax=Natronomicrosphaera hydrolytica TaxID=3242702 RepID=A0ABV4U4T6_9BACT